MRPDPTTCYQLAMDSVAYIPAPKRHRTRTTILTTIPTLAVIALAVIASILAPTACQPTPPATSTTPTTEDTTNMPACATEDSIGPCYWDATTRGNHTGRSFHRLTDGTTVYQ
jgi:hypothetical protein